jgi:hypothetical protein
MLTAIGCKTLAVLALVLLLDSSALAGGRASCRAEIGSEFGIRCAVEQTVFVAGPIEIAAGVLWRPLEFAAPQPYTAFLVYFDQIWATLEVAFNPSQGAFWAALSAGVRW